MDNTLWKISLPKLFEKNKRSNLSLKKKSLKKEDTGFIEEIYWKTFYNISFKPYDILTGASFGVFYLGTKPIAV